MSLELGSKLYREMMFSGFIDKNLQFKKGMFMNDDGKRLLIKQVYLKNFTAPVDAYMQYAHVVTVNGQLKSDPGVILGFDFAKKAILPILYRNDLLDHSIKVFQGGVLNEDSADWLLEYWADLFGEIKSDDYDLLDYDQLKVG